MNYFVLLVFALLTLAFFLQSVRAGNFELVVQNAEITPTVARIGELVSIDMTIKNNGNDTSCNVTAFCGDCVVGVQEISTIAKKSSVSLFFKLNTSTMSSGIYSIEVLIKKPSGEQKIFDLGAITIEQDDLTIPATEPKPSTEPTIPATEPNPSSTSPFYPNWLFLLPIVPAGATASILILRKRRNKGQDPAIPTEQFPLLLNEILKFEKEVESGAQNTVSNDKKKYIC